MKSFYLIPFVVILFSCISQETDLNFPLKEEKSRTTLHDNISDTIKQHANQYDTTLHSISKGTVSNGTLKDGVIVPFSGKNYFYFDTTSYLANRGFLHNNILKIVLNTYARMENLYPTEKFGIMECSNQHGGKIEPHRTHQNGTSVDFMSPLVKNNERYYALDYIGAQHYLLQFDAAGNYSEDTTVTIDFEKIARHLLLLEEEANKLNYCISKVIWMKELKNELYATPSGKKLKNSSIYITKNLSAIVNMLHDEHYHVDFERISK